MTLGIIGVVAALTMPALIQKYEKKVIATRAKQAYSMISQAIQLSVIENGETSNWNTEIINRASFENTELFLKQYILPYLKNPTFCADGMSQTAKDKCGAAAFSVSKSYILSNGVTISIMPVPKDMGKDIIINFIFDVNGSKKPNTKGSDQFQFYVFKKSGKISHINEINNFTREDLLKGKEVLIDKTMHTVACKKTKSDIQDTYYRHGCTALLMMDNWEFKDDYPW